MRIIEEIEKYIKLTDSNISLIMDSLELQTIDKNINLINAGESNNFIGFVEEGVLRSYKIDELGNDVTCHFFEQGSFFTDLFSYNKMDKISVSIEPLVNSKVYIIKDESLKDFELKIGSWNRFALEYYQMKTACLFNFQNKIKRCSANQAYSLFNKYYKHATQFSSKKHIASFLGVSRYTISRSKLN